MRAPQCTPMLILPCYHGDSVHKVLHLSAISHMGCFEILRHELVCSCAPLNYFPLGSRAAFGCQRG